MTPTTHLFARSEIATLTGVEDTTLSYWLREGLLIATSGGEGRGNHRRFDFMQVNIAAVLGAMRRFRLSLSPMRALADLLQAAARVRDAGSLHPSSYEYAARLASDLERFRAGEHILVPVHGPREAAPTGLSGKDRSAWYRATRVATSDKEVAALHTDRCAEWDGAHNVREVANRLGAGKEPLARIYASLTYDLLAPGYAARQGWLMTLSDDDVWQVATVESGQVLDAAPDAPDDALEGRPEPAIFLPINALIQRVWGLKSTESMLEEQDASRFAARAQ